MYMSTSVVMRYVCEIDCGVGLKYVKALLREASLVSHWMTNGDTPNSNWMIFHLPRQEAPRI